MIGAGTSSFKRRAGTVRNVVAGSMTRLPAQVNASTCGDTEVIGAASGCIIVSSRAFPFFSATTATRSIERVSGK